MRLNNRTLVAGLIASAFSGTSLIAWDSPIHSGIIHAALMAIPPGDGIQERLGEEVWRLREYVQMGDWINTLVSVREAWDAGGQTLQQPGFQFFANDYLLFPAAPRSFNHMVPDVKNTYRPYFIRALQALRSESPANAARWVGSLLHFVTDSGSPPHTIGITGPAHIKMESWLDPSLIDLGRYHPRMLGNNDEEALKGLLRRLDGLIAFSAIRAQQMSPFVKVDDRAHMEPLALESAAETARVAADLIHSLLQLTTGVSAKGTGSVAATVTAPALSGLENVPAKLVVMGTDYSTLSEPSLPAFHTYRGSFRLRNIPPGAYRLGIERAGSRTILIPVEVKAGETLRMSWNLEPDRSGENLAPNADLTLHWLRPDAPDHWRFDAPRRQWISDNIPVTPGRSYRAGCELTGQPAEGVELQWMAHAWEAMKTPAVPFDISQPRCSDALLTAPAGAMFVRFASKGPGEPSTALRHVFFKAE